MSTTQSIADLFTPTIQINPLPVSADQLYIGHINLLRYIRSKAELRC
jgi:hypothetical protein